METEKNLEPNSPKPNVKTYADDMAEFLSSDQAGMIKKIIEEEEGREQEKKNSSPESRRNKIFLAASAALVVLGASLFVYFFGRPPGTIEIVPQFAPIIFTDKSAFLEIGGLKKEEIIQSILNKTNPSGLKPNGVVAIYLTSSGAQVGMRQFLQIFELNFTPDANQALVSDSFMLGRVNVVSAGTEAPDTGFFVLLKTRSAADIFDALRAWEPKILYDHLHEFFSLEITSENNYLVTKEFEDGLVENKNARILRDEEGNIILMYVFADNNSVVITDSTEAAREVILRLNAKEMKE